MTEDRDLAPVGIRIRHYREMLGIRSSNALAALIPNPKITSVVIQNIEAGRKADVGVSQLLDIAAGLGISPLLLLVDVRHPFAPIDLPNVSDKLRDMLTIDFLAWARFDAPLGAEPAAAAEMSASARDLMVVAMNERTIAKLHDTASRTPLGSGERGRYEQLIESFRHDQSDAEARLEAAGISLQGLYEYTARMNGSPA
ncbi:MAG TPA: helix-turn-helix transcriptional regulator [Galbitalea sp.]